MSNLNPGQFGISPEEHKEIHAKAIAGALMDFGEEHFNLSLHSKMRAADELNTQFPGHKLKMDEENNPYHSVRHGDWEGRYFGGPYIEMHHRRYGPQEVLDVNDRHGNPMKFNHEHMQNAVRSFAVEDGPHYIESERRSRRGY